MLLTFMAGSSLSTYLACSCKSLPGSFFSSGHSFSEAFISTTLCLLSAHSRPSMILLHLLIFQTLTLMPHSCYGQGHQCKQSTGHPCLVLGSLSSFTMTLQDGFHILAPRSLNSTAKLEQVVRQMFLVFLPCHLISSTHWKILLKHLDKRVLWDLSAKSRFWPLASS